MIRFFVKSAVGLALLVLALYHFKVRIDDGKVIVERRGERERKKIERTVKKVGDQAKEIELEFRKAPQSAERAAAAADDAATAADHAQKSAEAAKQAADRIPEEDREALADLLEETP